MNNYNLIVPPAKEGGWDCIYCKENFRTRALLNNHKRLAHKGEHIKGADIFYKKRAESNRKVGYCKFCRRQFNTKSGVSIHEKYCDKNPEKIVCKGHKVSEETKRKLSEHSNRNPKKGAGRGIKGYYKGLYCMSTWELAWVVYQLEHDEKVEQCKERFPYIMDYKQHFYTPDFIINGIYYEIKNWHRPDTDYKISQFPKDKTLILIEGKKQNKMYLEYCEEKYGKNFYEVLYEKC